MGPTNSQAMVTFWRVIGVAGFAFGVISFVGALACGQHYLQSAPRNPQPESGKIYRYEEHGYAVYITRREQVVMNSLFVAAYVGGEIFLFVEGYKRNPFSKRTKEKNGSSEGS
jgi:hypothetical protein